MYGSHLDSWALAAAGGVSGALARATFKLYRERRRPQQLAWGTALSMFCVASVAAAIGLLSGWTSSLFRTYYLLGAVVNVPVLAVGTVFVLAPGRAGRFAAAAVAIGSLYAAWAVFSAPLNESGLRAPGIPGAAGVLPHGIRLISRIFSFAGYGVVAGGALWSALRLLRNPDGRRRTLAAANALIAAGTSVVAAASVFARRGETQFFSAGLLAGVSIMFWGFMKTRPGRREDQAGGRRRSPGNTMSR